MTRPQDLPFFLFADAPGSCAEQVMLQLEARQQDVGYAVPEGHNNVIAIVTTELGEERDEIITSNEHRPNWAPKGSKVIVINCSKVAPDTDFYSLSQKLYTPTMPASSRTPFTTVRLGATMGAWGGCGYDRHPSVTNRAL